MARLCLAVDPYLEMKSEAYENLTYTVCRENDVHVSNAHIADHTYVVRKWDCI